MCDIVHTEFSTLQYIFCNFPYANELNPLSIACLLSDVFTPVYCILFFSSFISLRKINKWSNLLYVNRNIFLTTELNVWLSITGGVRVLTCKNPMKEAKLTTKFQIRSPSPLGFKFRPGETYYYLCKSFILQWFLLFNRDSLQQHYWSFRAEVIYLQPIEIDISVPF